MSPRPPFGRPGSGGRRLGTGLALAGLYLVVAATSFHLGLLPIAPVLDGLGPPPPYQWVHPPPDRVRDNKPPSAGSGTIPFTASGVAGSVTTPDGQAQVLLENNALPRLPGQSSVSITMVPKDAASYGPPPSGGYRYDSNAYDIAAFYEPSNRPVVSITAVVVLTYATSADRVIQQAGSQWTFLSATSAGNNQLFASVTSLGVFATAVLPGASPAPVRSQQGSGLLLVEVLVPFAAIAAVVVFLIVRRSRGSAPRL